MKKIKTNSNRDRMLYRKLSALSDEVNSVPSIPIMEEALKNSTSNDGQMLLLDKFCPYESFIQEASNDLESEYYCDDAKKVKLVISYTDRPKRRLERDGVEHYFLSTEEFDKLKNDNKDNIVAYTKISKDDNVRNIPI